MKLVIIAHDYLNAMYLPILESIAASSNVELTLLCPERFKGGTHDWQVPASFQRVCIPIRYESRQGAYSFHFGALNAAIDRLKPDVILYEQEVYAVGAGQIVACATKRRIPLVFFVWENVHRDFILPRRMLRDFVLRSVSGIIAGSSGAKQVHRDWGFAGPMIVVPQMGVHVCEKPPFGRRGEDELRVCFAGRLLPLKGIDCLLRAIATLRDCGTRVSCTIAGQGVERERLAALTRQLAIEQFVDFSGQISGAEISRLFRDHDVLVLPSRRTPIWEEQFGRVLAEAMAVATVTVGSRTGAIPEVIGREDLLFDEDDSKGLAEILHRLANEHEMFEARQHWLWCRAKERYSSDHLAARKIQFLSEVLAASH